MDEADEESEKKAKEEKEQESELTWYKDNWELWKSEEDKAKKQLITRLEEAEEEIKNLETKTTRSQATSAIAGSGDDSGLEISTVMEATVCNCTPTNNIWSRLRLVYDSTQSLTQFLEELDIYHQEQSELSTAYLHFGCVHTRVVKTFVKKVTKLLTAKKVPKLLTHHLSLHTTT